MRAAGCVFAEEEARLLRSAARTADELAAMVGRRAAGEPVEHILGWAAFGGLRVAVGPGVFVPRRRSELLVREGTAVVRATFGELSSGHRAVVVDLCCGSGAVGAALAAAVGRVDLHAVDLDPAAVRCARCNVAACGGRVYRGDLYAALPASLRGRVDLVVANAPYVPTGELRLLPPEARLHERRLALDGGADGLDVQRRVVSEASGWLAPHGHVLVETSRRQAPATAAAVSRSGLVPRVVRCEDSDATVVAGSRPSGGQVAPHRGAAHDRH